MIRIGYGYDCHRFAEGDFVMIGGIKIPYEKSVMAHSDGDVLLHALVDALLGALALGDIGQHFSDTDPVNKNKPSSYFVTEAMKMIQDRGFQINNIDASVIAEQPRLAKHISNIRENIAQLLTVPLSVVSVKATTNEKMGWIGQGEGLAAHVVVLLSMI